MTAWVKTVFRVQAAALLAVLLTSAAWATDKSAAHSNAELVRQSFVNWQQGKGTTFDLLTPDTEWTVAGSSPVSGVYQGKKDFLERAVKPISARLATPIKPTVLSIVAEGDVVVVLWNGEATAIDQQPYRNNYLWHLTFKDGQVTQVKAFLDTYVLNDLIERVKPGA
ncbi:ketosteroid isomerase [Pseudomonas sp. S25]|uniref:Ketosteroid isomerase n=1 Tax=Pseudomonas maioricensis TaxID=1766623 RepID=A0ABS9ZKM2_9PSED|nr:nuclear transport factor 2 family protein [Pseudomonas sp. S25]MCI8211002.1 ketosteroid isomerase [Pseudomonas sp. S25]